MTISSIDAVPPDDAPDRAADTPAISAVGVSKRYGSITALDALTLDIRHGEVFGLLGPNSSAPNPCAAARYGASEWDLAWEMDQSTCSSALGRSPIQRNTEIAQIKAIDRGPPLHAARARK